MSGALVRSCSERFSIARRWQASALPFLAIIIATGLQGCSSVAVRPQPALAGFDRYSVTVAPRPEERAVYHRTVQIKRGLRVGRPYQIAGRYYIPRHQPNYDHVGVASWYGGEFVGRPTASGEVYDAGAMTAAHKTLPLNSLVRVTNLANGRAVTVRINDRGPFVNNRIIDLSRSAAERLEFAHHGLARVRVQVLQTAALD